MAGQVFVDTAEVLLLAQIRSPVGLDLFGDGMRLDLFTNNLAPIPTSIRTDFTLPILADYTPVLFDSTNLTIVVSNLGKAEMHFNNPALGTFTSLDLAGELCYGYTICATPSNSLICAELLDVPVTLAAGTPVVIVWKMTLFSEF